MNQSLEKMEQSHSSCNEFDYSSDGLTRNTFLEGGSNDAIPSMKTDNSSIEHFLFTLPYYFSPYELSCLCGIGFLGELN